MKKSIRLAIILLCGLLFLGCWQTDTNAPLTDEPNTSEALATEEPPAIEPDPQKTELSLSWAKAFRINTLPEGTIAPDEIAFFEIDQNGNERIVNVSKEEVFAYLPARLPRTRTLEQFIPDNLDSLLLTLDYAFAHGYSRFSIPTTEFRYGDIFGVQRLLNRIYYIDNSSINTLEVQDFETENGETLTYILVTIGGISDYKKASCYREGVAAAEAIVDSVPAGSSEFETALYLYQYLADHVEYDSDEYYTNGKQVLLYDALVKHKTVCAGYTEALYYLYNLAGIDCMIIGGYISDPVPRGEHVWNIACIDGTYYQFDATWDSGLMPPDYRYFAVSDAYMMANHTENVETFFQEYLPECPKSLFPEITLDVSETVGTETLYTAYAFFWLLNMKETDPIGILRMFGIDGSGLSQTETEDGWIVSELRYSDFREWLSFVMEDAQADRFCEGYYENRDGQLAYRKPEQGAIGWRLCALTENKDGSVLATAYLIDHEGNAEQADQLFHFSKGRIRSITEP